MPFGRYCGKEMHIDDALSRAYLAVMLLCPTVDVVLSLPIIAMM